MNQLANVLLPCMDRSQHPLTVLTSWRDIPKCCSHTAWCLQLDLTECSTALHHGEWLASRGAGTPERLPSNNAQQIINTVNWTLTQALSQSALDIAFNNKCRYIYIYIYIRRNRGNSRQGVLEVEQNCPLILILCQIWSFYINRLSTHKGQTELGTDHCWSMNTNQL